MKRPAHYNPAPKFDLRLDWPFDYDAYYAALDTDGWCVECGEPFHYDDVGGYNPPCSCGFHCRSCHESEEREMEWDNDHDWPEDAEDTP